MEENPLELAPAPASLPKRKINKRFIYLVLAILFLAILFISYRALNPETPQVKETTTFEVSPTIPIDSPTPTISETPTLTPTNTPTPKPTVNPVDEQSGLDRSELSVTIQNGSGEAGVAGEASDILTNLGYDVVSTGNAENFDFENVTIQVKSASSEFLDLLKKDLGGSYTIKSATSDLDNSFSSDALVIIGK